MADKRVLATCLVVGILGLLSTALGFGAEAKRIKATDVQIKNGMCIYPRSPSWHLGVAASLLLLLAQIIINSSAGCFCCKKHPCVPRSSWRIALICFILSWITFAFGFLWLLSAAALNNLSSLQYTYNDTCYVVRGGAFAGASVLSLSGVCLGIICYLLLSKKPGVSTVAPQNQGISMGQPHIPPQSTEPAFVHEDTYNRRQMF